MISLLLALLDDEPTSAPTAPEVANQPASPPVVSPPPVTPPAAAPTERRYPSAEVALRSGLSIPVGVMAPTPSASIVMAKPVMMSDVTALQVPLFFDFGARVSPGVFVGGYTSIAFGDVSDRFDRDACRSKCTTLSAHVGAQVHLHLAPEKRVDPWLGIGVGYEWFSSSGAPQAEARGVEIARPTAGVDFRLSPLVAFGIFVDGTVAAYTKAEIDGPPTGGRQFPYAFQEELDRPYVHSWVTFGIRFLFHARRK